MTDALANKAPFLAELRLPTREELEALDRDLLIAFIAGITASWVKLIDAGVQTNAQQQAVIRMALIELVSRLAPEGGGN